ncbi:AraC family transcriptional regulator [Methyloversatilis discipulorum]|uniref:AraC family transcriptional regulator n=1 Tax=Methyloversatilis discipulorum TaxID=1119528 RepID=UPI0012FC0938|nr:AraC family transcriptional regulator [Methyloversatilis discipulorum]
MIEPGDILVRKPNVSSFYQFDHTHRFLLVSLPMTEEILQLSSAFGYPELDFGTLHEHKLSDPFLASMLTQLWYGMLSGYVDPYHYLGAAAPMIVAEMASCSVRLSRKSRGGLSPGNKRRIIEFLHFNLEKRITVEMMARLAGLSQHYFVRAFKESFGIPPHQYLVQQRIAKARTLITESTQPLDAIAEMTGFSGHGAMSRAFKLAGLPPPNRHRRNP